MKNFLFQTFVLLPISLIESLCAAITITAIVLLTGDTGEDYGRLGEIIVSIICIISMIGFGLLDLKIRGYFDDSIGWWIFAFVLTPIRFLLQIIAGIFAFIALFTDSIESDKDFADDSFGNNIMSVLFNCYFDVGIGTRSYQQKNIDYNYNKELNLDKADESEHIRKPEKKERFGEENIKSRNILMQVLVILPITGLQLFLFILFYKGIANVEHNSPKQFLPILWIFLLLILAMILAQIKGHEIEGEYYEKQHRLKNKESGYHLDTDVDVDEEIYYDKDDWKKVKGGWTSYIKPISILILILSPVFVFTQVISIIIAIFSNPYRGRIFSWYGEIDYSYCRLAFLQKILHLFFNFVILEY